ncbi:hypothetical protein NEUTE1DRAFT_42601, partial [Neurospora tetrasperma FGSC 2508]
LHINLNKYEFYIKRVSFLSYIISLEGISINLKRIIIIVNSKTPTSVYNI